MRKQLIATAVGTALALSATMASAVSVVSWQLEDYNSDGLSSDFQFYGAPPGNSGEQFAAGAGDGIAIAMNTGEIGTNVFTTGFNFGGAGVFAPFIGDAGGTGNIAADITAGALTFSDLDFGGLYQSVNFYLPPDGGTGTVVVEDLTDLGGGDYGVVIRYIGTVVGGSFNGFQANWRLEGTMSTVPVPAAVWLFGSGLLGLIGVARRKKIA